MKLVTDNDSDQITVDGLFERIKNIHTRTSSTLNEYPIGEVKLPMADLKTTPDILNPQGGERLRRFGVLFGITAIPNYGEVMLQTSMLPRLEERLMDSDSLDELRSKLHETIDLALDIEDLRARNEKDAETLVNKLREFFQGLQS